jgi:RNA polymerase sigma-70 factor (ECF subfamily)
MGFLLDQDSFKALFQQYYGPLCRLAYPLVHHQEVAEDVVQDVFLTLWEKRFRIVIQSSVKAYLYKACVNASLNYLKKQRSGAARRLVRVPPDELETRLETHNQTEEDIHYRALDEELMKAIDRLPPRCKTAFLLSRLQEMSYREIAEVMEISVKGVEYQMSIALEKLRKELGPYLRELLVLLISAATSLFFGR